MSFNGVRLSLMRTESKIDRRKLRTSRRRPIGLEQLELRLVMSTSTWSGLGADANWSTPENWNTLPISGSDLVFPVGAAQLVNTDDLGSSTSFGTLTISGVGYSISA